jgi:hypothetical protein
MEPMKMTAEIPDDVHRRAKARAADSGQSLCEFITAAVKEELKKPAPKPWMKHIGKLRRFKKDLGRIDRIIKEEFEKIDPEMWELKESE